jgi:cytosine/adenosine deaminase-related metal-dependent hydrolase
LSDQQPQDRGRDRPAHDHARAGLQRGDRNRRLASSDNQNLFGAMRLAAILPRVVDPDYDRWPGAADTLRMATLNGARAAGFDGQIGAVGPGRKADLVLLDTRSTYYHPPNDLVGQLVFCEVGSSVRTVLVDGRVIVEDGRMTMVDEQA